MNLKEITLILEDAVNNGILDKCFEIYCYTCENYQGEICDSIEEACEKVCAYCGKDITDMDVMLVYRRK